MSRILGYFVRGCLVLAPTLLTLYILYALVTQLDALLGVSIPGLGVSIPGLGIVLTVAITTTVGLLFSNVIGRKVSSLIDRLFARLPLVKLLYTSIRDLLNAFLGEERRFGRAVSFRLSEESETHLFGFLTRDDLNMFALADHVAVYVPQAYNIGGQVLAVPRRLVQPLQASPTELLTFLVSGGASGFRDRYEKKSAPG